MDSTDKHIKDLYSSVDGTIPDHLSWDKMQAGIYDRMPGHKRRISPILWVILGISIGLALAGVIYLSDYTTSEFDATNIASNQTVRNVNPAQQNKGNEVLHAAGAAAPAKQRTTDKSIVAKTRPSAAKSRSAATATYASSSELSNTIEATRDERSEIFSQIASTTGTSYGNNDRSNGGSTTTAYKKRETIQKLAATSMSAVTAKVSSIDLQALVSQSPSLVVADLPNYQTWITPNTESSTLWRISAVTGSNYSSDRYGNYASMQTTTSGLWGHQAGILAARPLGKRPTFVEIGILVGEYNQRIQHEQVDEIITIDTSMMITAVNSLTGQTIAQRSVDTTMEVSRSRRLNYTNTVQRLHLRASLGHTISLTGKLQAHLALGMQVSRTISQSGYFIDDAREYRFAGQSRPLYTQWSSEIIPSLAVEYNITERYALYLGINSSVGITNATAIDNAHLRLRSVGLNAGVTMRL